jgi:hypothetical protein
MLTESEMIDYSKPCRVAEREEIFEACWCMAHQQYLIHCSRKADLARTRTPEELHHGAVSEAKHRRIKSEAKAQK